MKEKTITKRKKLKKIKKKTVFVVEEFPRSPVKVSNPAIVEKKDREFPRSPVKVSNPAIVGKRR